MANRPGIVFGGQSLDDLTARATVAANELNGLVEQMVRDMLIAAVEEVKDSINRRGVKNGMPFNGPRRDSDAMFNSVAYKLTYAKSGRVSGTFGYLNSPPRWAIFQEYGTNGGQGNGQGILAMLALTDAYNNFRVNLENALAGGGVMNLNEGWYRYDAQKSSY